MVGNKCTQALFFSRAAGRNLERNRGTRCPEASAAGTHDVVPAWGRRVVLGRVCNPRPFVMRMKSDKQRVGRLNHGPENHLSSYKATATPATAVAGRPALCDDEEIVSVSVVFVVML